MTNTHPHIISTATEFSSVDMDEIQTTFLVRRARLTPAEVAAIVAKVEADSLTPDQRGRYNEAIACGASHDDAMDVIC